MEIYSKIFPLETFPAYEYVVIFSRMGEKWLFSRHRDRQTWETQGGHIEEGETPLEAACRELYEESGAVGYTIRPVFDYWCGSRKGCGVGVIFLAEIEELGPLPESEMAEVRLFDELPENVTYPYITPTLYKEIMKL